MQIYNEDIKKFSHIHTHICVYICHDFERIYDYRDTTKRVNLEERNNLKVEKSLLYCSL